MGAARSSHSRRQGEGEGRVSNWALPEGRPWARREGLHVEGKSLQVWALEAGPGQPGWLQRTED